MARKKSPSGGSQSVESLGAATRQLTEATSALTAALKREASQVVPEAREALAASLFEAAQGLTAASVSVGRERVDRRRDRTARTRADLLAAAGRVFEEKGYEGASVGDIAAAAGYTKGALYSNFPSKADLFLALADERLCDGTDDPPPSFGRAPGAARQEALAEELRGTADRGGMLLVLEILGYGLRHPEARERLKPQVMKNLDDVAGWVAAVGGRDGDDARHDVDADAGGGGQDRDARDSVEAAPPGVEPPGVKLSREDRALAIFVLSVLTPPLAEFVDEPRIDEAAARVIDALLTS